MTTQTLRGLKGLEPFHWRGDRTNFLHFNIGFPGLLGGGLLTNVDMAAFRDFVNSIVFEPNPNQNLDRTLPAALAGASPIAGSNSFVNFVFDTLPNPPLRCITCHAAAPFQLPSGVGTTQLIIQDARLQESQHFKVPHLRDLYQKTGFANGPGDVSIAGFGFSHDGRDPTVSDVLTAPRFPLLTANSVVKSNLMAFLLCFDTGAAPAVGYSRTMVASNVNTSSISNDWSLLERQASQPFRDPLILAGSVLNISLIAKGTIDGVRRGLLYRPASADYLTDKSGVGPFSRSELVAKVMGGDTLTVMGVPPVSGQRMAVDRDFNGVLDGQEVVSSLTAVRSDTGVTISWPTGVGVVLEFTESLSPPNWRTHTDTPPLAGNPLTVAVPIMTGSRFYRLRGL